VHTHFTPLVLAISVVLSAAFAEDISTSAMQLASLYPYIALILLLDAVLFLSPLLFFTNKLWACRVKGLSDYMEFAAGYVDGFARKWIGQDPAHGNDPLGTPDLQSLADLNNSVNVVRNMRLVPGSRRLLASMAIAALLPMLPLLLLKYPVTELIEKLFKTLSGL